MSGRRSRARAVTPPLLIVALVGSMLTAATAEAGASAPRADENLSSTVNTGGTGAALTNVNTPALRDAAPASSSAPRILVIGTGVHRALFPAALQTSIVAPGARDGVDAHGYGTLATSVIFQVLPNAIVESRAVAARDALFTQIDMRALADAFAYARSHRGRFDAVLLAFPPQAALDPVADSLGRVNYGPTFGSGLAMVVEGMLARAGATTDGPVLGIARDRDLRARLLEGANLKQRDAIERYVAATDAWDGVTAEVERLADAGVAMVAPSGDLARADGGPLPTQTIFGLSAHPDVITVGAAYGTGSEIRVSPTSGRGPTLDLLAKPELLAPANVMGMLPGNASLKWSDDSLRVPLARLDWAHDSVPPTPCPSITNAYRCVLQGSAMVSAAIVSANLASLVAGGIPGTAPDRGTDDEDVLRGIAMVEASRVSALAASGDGAAAPWEQGAGVLAGLGSFDPARTPVPLGAADLGTVAWDEEYGITVPLWSGGARVAAASTTLTGMLGPDVTGRAIASAIQDSSRMTARPTADAVTVAANPARADGGVYAGRVTLTSPGGDVVGIPLHLVQGVNLDFHVNYAYNEFQTGGIEGERVEKATAILFAGMPPNVGLVGEAFKHLSGRQFRRFGGDPTNGPILRYATTQDSFTDPSVAARDHGRGTMKAVPPGFYKFHIVTDHSVEARQTRGVVESLGIQLASTGPDAAVTFGANLLVPSDPACDATQVSDCVPRDGEVDPSSGLCIARNTQTTVSYRYYCGEIGLSVPSAIISRAVHHIQHADDPARSEWQTCNVGVEMKGAAVDLGQIVDRADPCDGGPMGASWKIATGGSRCLGPSERAAFPNGHPNDVRATFSSMVPAGTPGAALPAAVLTYEFPLPYLNTYTTTGLAFSYVAENAIIGVRFQTGNRPTDDASHGLLVIDDPDLSITPALEQASSKGSIFTTWDLMTANAERAQVSLIIIPTKWSSVGSTKPAATVELCDVSLRVHTFAKQTYGQARMENGRPVQFFPVLDRGLTDQIDPGTSRVRATWDDRTSAFVDRGREPETLSFAVQIPKNTTTDPRAEHHVLSPHGGPAHFVTTRRWGTDARRHESVLPSSFQAHDPRYGLTALRCGEGPEQIEPGDKPADIAAWETCKAVNDARRDNELIGGLFDDMWANGRFTGIMAIDYETIARAAGNVAFEVADADDRGAFEQRWKREGGTLVREFEIPNFYDDAVGRFSLNLLGGAVSVRENGTGHYVLAVSAGTPGGTTYSISTTI